MIKKKISIRSTLKFQTISLVINHYKVIERKNPNTGTCRVNFEYFPTFLYRAVCLVEIYKTLQCVLQAIVNFIWKKLKLVTNIEIVNPIPIFNLHRIPYLKPCQNEIQRDKIIGAFLLK